MIFFKKNFEDIYTIMIEQKIAIVYELHMYDVFKEQGASMKSAVD